jgi:hypothetical protein
MQLDDHVGPGLPQQAGHALERQGLASLDIDLDQGRRSFAITIDPVIQTNHFYIQ